MKETTKAQIARGILPGVGTILSITLAVTLRVEHACSDNSSPVRDSLPSTLYPYSEMIAKRVFEKAVVIAAEAPHF